MLHVRQGRRDKLRMHRRRASTPKAWKKLELVDRATPRPLLTWYGRQSETGWGGARIGEERRGATPVDRLACTVRNGREVKIPCMPMENPAGRRAGTYGELALVQLCAVTARPAI